VGGGSSAISAGAKGRLARPKLGLSDTSTGSGASRLNQAKQRAEARRQEAAAKRSLAGVYGPTKIVAIVAGADPGFPKSRICSIRGLEQKLLGALKTIRIALEKTRDPMNWIDQSYQTKTIYNMILSGSPTGRGSGAPLLANNVLTKIIDYISKLELFN
jgi:hypothetical protein